MKRLLLPFLLLASSAPLWGASTGTFPAGFQEARFIETSHFRLYHESNFAPVGMTGLLEGLYATLSLELGDFATWNPGEKLRVFVYRDAASYVDKTGIPAWSAAFADPTSLQVHCYESAHLARIMAHEMAHLFLTPYFMEKGVTPPVWLNEGVAKMMEWNYGQGEETGHLNRTVFSRGLATPLPDMMTFDYHHGGSTSDGLSLWYQQSASVTAYLMRRFPRAQFVRFCSALREGKTTDQALQEAYGFQVPDVAALERLWRGSLSE